MLAPISFDYAVIRVVPRVEREEFINAGVVVFCLQQRFLEARIHLDDQRLLALWPEIDLDLVRNHVEAFPRICAADPTAGPISQLSQRERFHWLVSPRSTIIQVSPVHTGLCDAPENLMDNLARRYLNL
ncbi:DUF3037 domain-containing protein [Tunturiibacter psychrotolerans]|uniref:DUF3037 domain-containing protein n=1 Tax=Tunturiibacter psychrotolerans TaxID=3069686 RepID=UPI003D1FFD5F